jgi:hypothetical protein
MLTQGTILLVIYFMANMLTDFEAHVLCVDPLGEDLSLYESAHLSCFASVSEKNHSLDPVYWRRILNVYRYVN